MIVMISFRHPVTFVFQMASLNSSVEQPWFCHVKSETYTYNSEVSCPQSFKGCERQRELSAGWLWLSVELLWDIRSRSNMNSFPWWSYLCHCDISSYRITRRMLICLNVRILTFLIWFVYVPSRFPYSFLYYSAWFSSFRCKCMFRGFIRMLTEFRSIWSTHICHISSFVWTLFFHIYIRTCG